MQKCSHTCIRTHTYVLYIYADTCMHTIYSHIQALTERDHFSFSQNIKVILQNGNRDKYSALVTRQSYGDFFFEISSAISTHYTPCPLQLPVVRMLASKRASYLASQFNTSTREYTYGAMPLTAVLCWQGLVCLGKPSISSPASSTHSPLTSDGNSAQICCRATL